MIAKYKNDYCKGKKYYLDNQSEVAFIIKGSSFERVKELSQSPYQHYLTRELAEQAKKIKDFNDKLLAFKYCYDLDYKSDWNNIEESKYYIYYDKSVNAYGVSSNLYMLSNCVYFSTSEIAKKCADWLNSMEGEK